MSRREARGRLDGLSPLGARLVLSNARFRTWAAGLSIVLPHGLMSLFGYARQYRDIEAHSYIVLKYRN